MEYDTSARLRHTSLVRVALKEARIVRRLETLPVVNAYAACNLPYSVAPLKTVDIAAPDQQVGLLPSPGYNA
jgi:hypothetical protein